MVHMQHGGLGLEVKKKEAIMIWLSFYIPGFAFYMQSSRAEKLFPVLSTDPGHIQYSINICWISLVNLRRLMCFLPVLLPAEGIVSPTKPGSRFLFFGSFVLQSCSKWICIGLSMVRKLHCNRPLKVVAAISRTCRDIITCIRAEIPNLLEYQRWEGGMGTGVGAFPGIGMRAV